jgi:hypothetical protein
VGQRADSNNPLFLVCRWIQAGHQLLAKPNHVPPLQSAKPNHHVLLLAKPNRCVLLLAKPNRHVVVLAKPNRHVVQPVKHNSARLLRGNRTKSFRLCSCQVMVIFYLRVKRTISLECRSKLFFRYLPVCVCNISVVLCRRVYQINGNFRWVHCKLDKSSLKGSVL